jgi:hypothetical protein
MGVDRRVACNTTSGSPTQRAAPSSKETDLRDLIEKAMITAAGYPACNTAGWEPVSRSPGWPHDELKRCLERGKDGDAKSARRVAELLEIVEDFEGAATWWHRAAHLGDGDAADYVRVILNG